MSLKHQLKRIARWLKNSKRDRTTKRALHNRHRSVTVETMEPRLAMTADPIWVGGVYIEEDIGSDQHGDRFVVTFKGGAPGTQLNRLIIDGDLNTPGFGLSDLFFDTDETGLGADHAFAFHLERMTAADPNATVNAIVSDASTRLILEFANFRAGDVLVFSIDVDEAQAYNPSETDLDILNSGFDPITSGVEFQGSLFRAEFSAPHYENASAQNTFLNRYDPIVEPSGLQLPADNFEGKRDRSAGTAAQVQQVPKPISLAGIVYVDNNLDLTLQQAEQRLSGVRLELFAKSGASYVTTGRTAVTDAQGRYNFGTELGLQPGSYQIRQTQPDGYFSVGVTLGVLNDNSIVGQKIAGNPDWLTEINIPLGDQHATQLNFAEAQPASLSGYVFADDNNNGIRDSGEGGLAGITVQLTANNSLAPQPTLTVATNNQGFYRFDNLSPGTYTVTELIQPVGYLDGRDTAGRVGSQTRGTASNEVITNVRLDGNDSGVEYNFGEILPGSISGQVFADTDDDCLLDAPNDRPLSGVIVELLDEQGRILQSTSTDSDGKYRFDNLLPGRYSVRELQPSGYFQGGQVAGSGGGDASQPDLIRSISLAPGDELVNYDFCEVPPAEISGIVFVDRDADCLWDSGEVHLSGITISLLDESGVIVEQTVTDASGAYRFTNLRPGIYTLRETQPAGYLHGGQTAGSAGGDDTLIDEISFIPIGAGQVLVDYNFCEIEPAELSGYVFADRDADCEFDSGETPIGNVQITLLDSSGTVVQTTFTDVNGYYHFANLAPGNYTVQEVQPNDYFHGGQIAGSSGGNDSVADQISQIPVSAGQILVDYNFCELEPSELSGYVFVDRDQDCLYDTGEQSIAGVTVTLFDEQGKVVSQTQTDSMGFYRFHGLRPGQYTVEEQQPNGFMQGGQRAGSGGGDDSFQDVISAISIGAGEVLTEYNFCEVAPSSISGQVFVDTDFDCVRDPDESPLAGVVIELLNADGDLIASTLTDNDGRYHFENLPPGKYSVRELQPDGYFHGGQVAPAGNGNASIDDLIHSIDLESGTQVNEANFCEVPPARLSGFVFQDGPAISSEDGLAPENLQALRDGLRTADDRPISNVRVQLRTVNGLPLEADRALPGYYAGQFIEVVTDSSGYYEFSGLRPGAYHVYQFHPVRYFDGLDTPGTTGGFSVNRNQTETSPQFQLLMLSLTASDDTNPGFDAILLVSLEAGQHSMENNFSEILTRPQNRPPQVPPLPPGTPPEPPKISVTPPVFAKLPPITAVPLPWSPLPIVVGASLETPPTWHLSVINGGFPRGRRAGQPVRDAEVARKAELLNVRAWTVRGMRTSSWRIVSTLPISNLSANRSVFDVPGSKPVTGDFNGDGLDELALFVDGEWFIDQNGNGVWDQEDIWLKLGYRGDQPVAGDWDGDGKDDVGVFGRKWVGDERALGAEVGLPDPENRRRVKPKNLPPNADEAPEEPRLMKRSNLATARADLIDHVFRFGASKDIAIAGDFNGDGISSIGVFQDGKWTLDVDGDGILNTSQDLQIEFGQAGDLPLVGDFDGNGIDDTAILRGNHVIVDSNHNGRIDATDQVFMIDQEEGTIVVGDFDGDGKDEPALHQSIQQRRTLEARRAG